jgi:hypothetical protein
LSKHTVGIEPCLFVGFTGCGGQSIFALVDLSSWKGERLSIPY